jgi:hypothetical protein
MAISQVQHNSPGRTYYLRKRAEGKGHKEAIRCLKRRLSDLVYRQRHHDATEDTTAGPGGYHGATLSSSAAPSTPITGSFDQSLPGPTTHNPATPTPRSTWQGGAVDTPPASPRPDDSEQRVSGQAAAIQLAGLRSNVIVHAFFGRRNQITRDFLVR